MALESIDAGVWSLVPALVAIALAWYTREALAGLFLPEGFRNRPVLSLSRSR